MKSEPVRHTVSGSRVRGRWMKLIAAVLVSRTDLEAAAKAGLSVRTLYRKKRDPAFMADLQAAKDSQFETAISSLRGNALAFTDRLKEISDDPKAPANARVRASEVGLNVLLKATELEDLARRIRRLEESVSEAKN